MVTDAWEHSPYHVLNMQKVSRKSCRWETDLTWLKSVCFQDRKPWTNSSTIFSFCRLLTFLQMFTSPLSMKLLCWQNAYPHGLFSACFALERIHKCPGWGIVQMTREALATIANPEFLHEEKKSGSYSQPADKHSKQLIFGGWSSISLIKTTTHPTQQKRGPGPPWPSRAPTPQSRGLELSVG